MILKRVVTLIYLKANTVFRDAIFTAELGIPCTIHITIVSFIGFVKIVDTIITHTFTTTQARKKKTKDWPF